MRSETIRDSKNQQRKSCEGQFDIGSIRIPDVPLSENGRMWIALKVLHTWNERGLLDGRNPTREQVRNLIANALGIREDVA